LLKIQFTNLWLFCPEWNAEGLWDEFPHLVNKVDIPVLNNFLGFLFLADLSFSLPFLMVKREQKLKDKIFWSKNTFLAAKGRFEYWGMNIAKRNQRFADIKDEIQRVKVKIKKVANRLGEIVDGMFIKLN
jgi:hypothetical protein